MNSNFKEEQDLKRKLKRKFRYRWVTNSPWVLALYNIDDGILFSGSATEFVPFFYAYYSPDSRLVIWYLNYRYGCNTVGFGGRLVCLRGYVDPCLRDVVRSLLQISFSCCIQAQTAAGEVSHEIPVIIVVPAERQTIGEY